MVLMCSNVLNLLANSFLHKAQKGFPESVFNFTSCLIFSSSRSLKLKGPVNKDQEKNCKRQKHKSKLTKFNTEKFFKR